MMMIVEKRNKDSHVTTPCWPCARGSGLDLYEQRERRREKKVEDHHKRTV